MARAEAPPHVGVIGLGMAGPTIIAHGSEAQKARHLEPILSAEDIWCQGFSEPGAGSDLAGVRTSARLDDGRFVVDGQKVWSSFAHLADWCLLLARSGPGSQRHDGLTYLIVDMHAPGVEECGRCGRSRASRSSTRSSSRAWRYPRRTRLATSARGGRWR